LLESERVKNRVVFAVFLLVAFGCKPDVGSSCDKGEARCIDGKRQLVCQAGKFIESPCGGPGGCALGEKGTSCDFSKNKPGDACSTDDEGAALCAGTDQMIACRAGKYQHVPCRGPKGCANEGGFALCDQAIAAVGDACKDENKKACAVEGKSVLLCRDHKMDLLLSCRGPRGCSAAGGKLDCDMSIAKKGDPCDKTQEGSVSCNEEASSTLICKNQSFTFDEKCKPGTRCVAEGTSTQCLKPE